MKRPHGFTLIEVIIFIVIVSVGVVGILSVFQRSVQSSADPMVRKQTLAIAESMLEEILQKEYSNPPGGDAGSARVLFDDVDQYDNYSSPTIVDAANNTISGLTGYSITSVQVSAPLALTGGGTTLVKRVVVTVTGPQGPIVLTGYRGNY